MLLIRSLFCQTSHVTRRLVILKDFEFQSHILQAVLVKCPFFKSRKDYEEHFGLGVMLHFPLVVLQGFEDDVLQFVLVKFPFFKSRMDCEEHFIPSWSKDLGVTLHFPLVVLRFLPLMRYSTPCSCQTCLLQPPNAWAEQFIPSLNRNSCSNRCAVVWRRNMFSK